MGWKPSRLKPEFFEKQEEAKNIALSLNDEAGKLAATGDVDAIKDQFGKVCKTSKSCHDK
ncbi:MAG: cytochrome c [Methylobacter sp.]